MKNFKLDSTYDKGISNQESDDINIDADSEVEYTLDISMRIKLRCDESWNGKFEVPKFLCHDSYDWMCT